MSTATDLRPPGSPPSGVFLSLDTSGKTGSVALGRMTGVSGGFDLLTWTDLPQDGEQAALLVPTIARLLAEAGAGPQDLAGIVLGAGPGSFTGVRVGAATAKGLAWALKIPIWALSSLAGAAVAVAEEPERPRLVLFDARGDRLYAGAYSVTEASVKTLLEPRPTTLHEVLDAFVPPGGVIVGDGALRHQDLLEGTGSPVLPFPAGRPSALGLLRMLAQDPSLPPVQDVGGWSPSYLRESGAERLRRPEQERAES